MAPQPATLGDAFALLYDGLDEGLVCSRHGEQLLGDEAWRRRYSELADVIADTGAIPSGANVAATGSQDDRLLLLLALDEALAPVWPGWGCPVPPSLVPVRAHWSRTGRLTSDPSQIGGAVLFRHVRPQRPEGQAELETLFGSLVRVSRSNWELLQHKKVHPAFDFSADAVSRGTLKIAVCPIVADINEIDIHSTRGGDQKPAYRLAGRDCESLRDRIRQIIPHLDASGADMAVLPEGVLSATLLGLWTAELRRSFHNRPRTSALRWVLVGTGPTFAGDTRNTAVLLHRSGSEIMRQDKRYPFKFTQAADWGLDDLIAPAAEEDIERGGHRVVLESEFGRVAVTICEDLARPLVFERGLRQAAPSLLLVPVFNIPFGEHNWARAGSKDVLLDIGSRVVVINSLAVASRQPRAGTCYALGTFCTEGPDSYVALTERRDGAKSVSPPSSDRGRIVELFHLRPSAPERTRPD